MYHNSKIDEIMDRAGGRTMYVSADTGDELTLSYYGDVKSFTFNGGSNLTDSLSIGNTTMSSIEMELIYDPSQTALQERITDGARIELNIEVKLDNGGIGTIPMGVFYAINPELIGVSSDGKETYSVKANDGMCKKTGLYSSDLTYPTNWWAVWQELGGVDNKGFKAELEALSDYELLIDNPIPNGYTKREMIGFIAAKVGRFACYDRHGNLTAHYYGEETDVVKPTKVFYDFKKSAKVTVGTVVVNKDSDTKFTATTGVGGITLANSNPLGTQEATNKIAQKMATLEYNIANATILGDFRIDCWDIISVEYLDNVTYKIPAMSLTHDMSGGIKTSIASVGSSATEDEADYSGPVIKAIERTNAELLTVNELIAGKATIEQLNATNANVTNLQTNKLDANMANINVANIDVAKVGSMFAQVGLIDRATISEGHITGYLDSVEVNANNITAGTLVADRLLLKNGNNYVGFTTDGTNVVKADIDADDIIKDHTITADHIVAHTITANEVDVASLTADSAFVNAISTNSVVVGAMNNAATNKVNELQIGGRNLQLGTEYWSDSCFWAKTGVTITDDTMKVELGKYPRLALIPVKPKEEYTLSVDIKSDIAHDETVTNKPILLDYYNSSNTRVVYENIPIAKRVETDWNRYSYTFVVPDNSNITQLSIGPRSGDTYVHYFRHLKLERGNKATDYSPAPEDSEAYADSAVKVVTDNIYTPNTTTIDGGKITTSSIKAEQIDVDNLFAQEIEASGSISVNNTETGSNIKLQNGKIIISGTLRGLVYEVGKIVGNGNTNFVNAYGNWVFDHIPYLASKDEAGSTLGLFNVMGVSTYKRANYMVEKYIDGRMRMIYKETQTLNISSASGNIKYANVSTPDFPEEFIEAPVIVWSTNSQGGNAWIWGRTAPTKTNSGGAYVGRGSANSSVKLDVIFVAEGYWK